MNLKKQFMFPEKTGRRPVMLSRVLFIDPGIGGTGWAFFKTINTSGKGLIYDPLNHGVFTPKPASRWEARVESVCAWFAGVCPALTPEIVVLEFPELWAASAKSFSSAERGDLFKLAYLIGGLAEVARQCTTPLPVLISPQSWKGQLPKRVVEERVSKLFKGYRPADHEADAIGMGYAAQGGL